MSTIALHLSTLTAERREQALLDIAEAITHAHHDGRAVDIANPAIIVTADGQILLGSTLVDRPGSTVILDPNDLGDILMYADPGAYLWRDDYRDSILESIREAL